MQRTNNNKTQIRQYTDLPIRNDNDVVVRKPKMS